jgi:hypothetical protein
LRGIVEAGEAYIGSKESNRHEPKKQRKGRDAAGKSVVFGMKERDGRTIAKAVSSAKAEGVKPIVNTMLAPRSARRFPALQLPAWARPRGGEPQLQAAC